MAIGNHNDLTHIVRTSDQWKNTYDKYELIPTGVLCVELVSSDVTKIKIGDGHNIFSKLPYIGDLDLSKYYTKLETDTRIKEILTQEKVVRIKGLVGSKSDLPADARCGDIYFVRQLSSSDNKYIEYIYSPDNTWEPLGGIPVDIDLSEYAKTAYVDDKIEQVNERIDDIEQHGTHTHPNKEILDQITEPYTTADKETLASLHNYDDTEIREMISQSSHTHSNKDILDATSAAFTKEDKSKLDQLNPYDDSTIKERITELERVAHEHSNKRILDQTTASFTKEYERKMRWIRMYTGCTGMEEGIAGLVPAAQAGEEDYVLSGSGEWVPQTGGGGTYELPIATTSTLGGIKVGDGLEIDANGKLSVVGGGGGGDSIAEGDGITITTDPQTGVKTISVNTGNHLEVDENTGELNVTDVDYEAGHGIHIGADYTLIEYIKNSGNYDQIIITDIIPVFSDKIELDIKFGAATVETVSDDKFFGCYNNSSTAYSYYGSLYLSSNSYANIGIYNHFKYESGNTGDNFFTYPDGVSYNGASSVRHTLTVQGSTAKWNNSTRNFSSYYNQSFSDPQIGIAIFGMNKVSGDADCFSQCNLTVYGVKLYDSNNTLLHDLRPAERGIDGEAGLYDILTNKFYGNVGNGSFVKGPAIISLDRIISAKIGNGLQFDSNDAIEVVTGNGLSVNQDNELEVNTGNGLQINQDGELEIDPSIIPEVIEYNAGEAIDISPSGTDLPAGYADISYIESTGSQWTQLGYYANNNSRAVVDYVVPNTVSTTSDAAIFGSGAGSNQAFVFWDDQLENNQKGGFVYGSNSWSSSTDANRGRNFNKNRGVHTILDCSVNGCFIDNNLLHGITPTGNFSSTVALGVFASANGDQRYGYSIAPFRIYSFKIYENDALEVDLRPALRLSDNKPGFYDVINDDFYPSLTSTDFVYDSSSIDTHDDIFINVKYNKGLTVNSNNELEVNIGTGLEIDPQTGAINVTGGGSGDTVEAGDGIDIDTDSQTGNKVISIDTGNGLQINQDGEVEIDPSIIPDSYDAGNGIEITEVTHEDEFRVQNQEYFFTDHGLTCIITGNYGPRTFTKINDGDIVAAVIGTTGGWYMPLFVGLTEDSVKYSNSYDSNILGPDGSFTYHDKTWYYTANYALTAGDGVDHAGHLQSMTDTIYDESAESKIQAAKDLIDLAVLLPDVSTPTISAKIGAGLSFDANGAIQADAQPLSPATDSTLGGVIVGDGILVDNDGTISVDPTIIPEVPAYEAGTAISIEEVEHGGVTFDAWDSGTGWENVCYSNSTGNAVVTYTYEAHSPISNSYTLPTGATHIRAIAYDQNDNLLWTSFSWIDSNNYHFASTSPEEGHYSDWFEIPTGAVKVNFGVRHSKLNTTTAMSLNDIKSVNITIQTISEIEVDVWNGGSGWLNGNYYSGTSDTFTTSWPYSYHSNPNAYIPIPNGATHLMVMGISNENDSHFEGGGVNVFSAESHSNHIAWWGCAWEWHEISSDAKFVQIDVKWSNGNTRTISATDIKSVTLAWKLPALETNTAINVKYGNGLTVNQNNELEVELSPATETDLGGIKIGTGFTYLIDGTLNANPAMSPFEVGDALELLYDDPDALPTGYAHVDYVSSNPATNSTSSTNYGRARTLIDYTPENVTKLEIKMARDNDYQDSCFVGCRVSGSENHFVLWHENRSSDTQVAFVYGSKTYNDAKATVSYVTGQVQEIEASIPPAGTSGNITVSVNGSVVKTYAKSGSPLTYKLGIFQSNRANEWEYQISNGRIYYLRLYEGNTLAVNLIPAVRLADEVVGFYDNVNDKFYTSSTDYPFTTDMSTIVIDGAHRTLNAKYNNGLMLNQNNELEVNIGTGLEFDQVTGAINVIGGGGSSEEGNLIVEGDGIEINSLSFNIPKNYAGISYIEGNGQQWTQLDYTITHDTRVVIEMSSYETETTSRAIFGSRRSENPQFVTWLTAISGSDYIKTAFVYGSNEYDHYYDTTVHRGTRFTLDASVNGLYINNTLIQSITDQGTMPTDKLGLFAIANGDGTYETSKGMGKYRIFSVKIYDGNSLEMDLVPLLYLDYEHTAKIPGLYDLINETFYPSLTLTDFVYDASSIIYPVYEVSAKLGNGLRFDSNGAIEVTGGSGGGNSGNYIEGEAIEFKEGASRLPTGYTELENISNVSASYIDTGYIPNTDTQLSIIANIHRGTTSWQTLFGARDAVNPGGTEYAFFVRLNDNYNFYPRITGDQYTYMPNQTYDEKIRIDINNTTATVTRQDGSSYSYTQTGSLSNLSTTLAIFALHNQTGYVDNGIIDLYSFKIYENNTIVKDFVPCKRNSDDAIGLIDIINNVFYTNLGTGTFTAGRILTNTSINVKYGTGLSVDPVTNELFVDGQLPEGTIIKKLTYVGDGGANTTIQFDKKPLAIITLYGQAVNNKCSAVPTVIDADVLMSLYGSGSTSQSDKGGTVCCEMSYDDSTNVLTLSKGYDTGARYNISGETYQMYYLTKGHTGSGTSVNNEVSVIKSFTYVGDGTNPNNIQFPETPDMLVTISAPGGDNTRLSAAPSAMDADKLVIDVSDANNNNGVIGCSMSFNSTTNVLTLSTTKDISWCLNMSGTTYTVFYAVNEVISTTMPYAAGEAISIETIGGLQLTDYSNDDFVDSIASMNAGSIVKATDKSSFTLTASGDDCYTRGASGQANGSYPFNVKASTKYRFAWDSSDPTIHGKVYTYENGLYDAMMHEIDQYDSSYLEFTTSPNTTFIQARFGVMYAGDSITYSNVRLYEVIETEDEYDEISVKYNKGLSVNQNNELEVNIGTGLAFDPQTGAINVTGGGGGSGDTVAEGAGIEITTDQQTGNKVIAINPGAGLQVNQTTNELEVSSGVVTSIAPTQNTPGSITVTEGDGTTTPVSVISQMGGATSSTAGTAGYVPAPASGDDDAYLRGDGTWDDSVLTEDDELTLVFVPDDYQPS